MRILYLGPSSPLVARLEQEEEVWATTAPITVEHLRAIDPDWTVSYRYRHIIKGEALERVIGRAINLHISYLPWNRGADPNLWSIVDGTPTGVTIHFIDAGVDTGDLIAQREVQLAEDDTLATGYQKLQAEIQDLFRQTWPAIREGKAPRRPQPPGGSSTALRTRSQSSTS